MGMEIPLEPASLAARDLSHEQAAAEGRLLRQRDALVSLTAAQTGDWGTLSQTVRRALEVSSATLGVARASLWRFHEAPSRIACSDLYEARSGRHSSGQELFAHDYPAYFVAVHGSDVVAVDDAEGDARTAAFTTSYLRPNGISSMLDAPVHADGVVAGVLCHEHIGPARQWTADEQSFAIAVSNLLAWAIERCERSRAESTSALQAAALAAAADASLIADSNGLIVWINPAFTALTGYEWHEAIGKNPRDLLRSGVHGQEYYERLWNTLKHGQVWRGEMTNRRKDGTTYVEDQTITPVKGPSGAIGHFIAVKRDLTEKRRLEAQFLQAQKMEVVGRLAGGVAHDFNNLLTVINGNAEFALMDLDERLPIAADLRQILEAGGRAASLTRQLLAFSRKQTTKKEPVDLGGLLAGLRGILQRLIGEDIELSIAGDAGTTGILADASQIEQVILNLAVNSRDAMPGGGQLSIAAVAVELDEEFADRHAGAAPGPHVMLVVKDTGQGMSQEVMARIFEPFFTTKESGKGTGLGLATVYAIVQQSGGTIWATSEPGEGTTFRVYLPRVAARVVVTAPAGAITGGGETVLLVEDEDAVREVGVRILESAGYKVLSASDAAVALERLKHQAHIDVLVTDVVLRGVGGRELADRALALHPNLAVLFTSGYTNDVVSAHGVASHSATFIAKPYTPIALSNKVREILTGAKVPVAPRSRVAPW
jgi:two-component system cell cycle sensor histidine kinase/response regulator CckA